MTVNDILKLVNPYTFICIETVNYEDIYSNEAGYIPAKYKSYEVNKIYPHQIKALGVNSIVIQVNIQEA